MPRPVTLIVPIDSALNRARTGLSQATIAILRAAIEARNKELLGEEYVFAYGNTDWPHAGVHAADSLKWKGDLLDERVQESTTRYVVDITSSIDEAENIRTALAISDVQPVEIIIFCDWWHGLRLRLIWRHVFPGVKKEYRSVKCTWGPDYATVLQRSSLRWNTGNLVGAILMLCFGVRSASKVKQPTSK